MRGPSNYPCERVGTIDFGSIALFDDWLEAAGICVHLSLSLSLSLPLSLPLSRCVYIYIYIDSTLL